jgi:TRAP-type mannitol/chloroaromatic compound transport system permease large subunit
MQALASRGKNVLTTLGRALVGDSTAGVARRTVFGQLVVSLVPALAIVALLGFIYRAATAPVEQASVAGLIEAGGEFAAAATSQEQETGLIGQPPPEAGTPESSPEKPAEAPRELGAAATADAGAQQASPQSSADATSAQDATRAAPVERLPAPTWFWIVFAIGVGALVLIYWLWNWERFEVFKLLLTSFFPLSILILAVLGSIVFGLATPAEAAAVGAFGGFVLTVVYRAIAHWRGGATGAASGMVKELGGLVKESSFLTARTSAMVCWLFVGSGIFSAAFALLGGQELLEKWVLSLDLTPIQFMILAQIIIFLLGWPLEWTEIIIIFMPIFIPLLPHFNIDPLFFGLMVALNLQTAFLSPPVAMAAFYLKGVSPPHVTLNQIFAGMLPFMGLQIVSMFVLYMWPQLGLWLPQALYK